MDLRPYQSAALDAIETGWKDYQRQLCVLPTGTGKTIAFAHLAAREASRGRRTMILAHRDELLIQAQDKIRVAVGMDTALEKADNVAYEGLFRKPITVASVQTLHSRRLEKWDRDAVDLLVIDEAHHALSNSYRAVIGHFDKARVLGVTATPDRGDKQNLGNVFESIAYEYGIRDAIADGYLAPIAAQLIPVKIDLTKVRTVAGDYNAADLDESLLPYLDHVMGEVASHIDARQTLMFLPLVRTSQAAAAMLRARGITAEHVDGASKDRADILARYAAGEFQVLCNSALLFEGYDCPNISCVIPLRPTQSRSLYSQMIGRGTRIAPGKTDLLVLDFLWQTTKHNLCQPASLFAKCEDEARSIMAEVEPGGAQIDLLEAESTAKEKREQALRKKLEDTQRKQKRVIDPVSFALSIDNMDLAEWEPEAAWHERDITPGQRSALTRFGIDMDMVTCRGHASAILDTVFARSKAGLCTPKQAALLGKYGYSPNVGFDEAKSIIDEIAANGWRRPAVAVLTAGDPLVY